jgi:hypothetical protein
MGMSVATEIQAVGQAVGSEFKGVLAHLAGQEAKVAETGQAAAVAQFTPSGAAVHAVGGVAAEAAVAEAAPAPAAPVAAAPVAPTPTAAAQTPVSQAAQSSNAGGFAAQFWKIFTGAAAVLNNLTTLAAAEAPVVDLAATAFGNPGLAASYNSGVQLALLAEHAAMAAVALTVQGLQSGL